MSFGLAEQQLHFDIKLKMIDHAMQVTARWRCLLDVLQRPNPYDTGI